MIIQKYKKDFVHSYTLGAVVTIELIKNRPNSIIEILICDQTSEDIINELQYLSKKNHFEIRKNNKAFNILSDKENCYIIGVFKKTVMHLEDKKPHICLVNPSNAGNLGTIIRSAVGFGIINIAIIKPAVDCFDPKIIRASMGAIFYANIEYFENFEEYYNIYPDYYYYPFMLKSSNDLRKISFNNTNSSSLIFGNEQTGLSDSFLEIGLPIRIEHSKRIDSLNLAQAVNIALYEFTKYQNFN